MQKSTPDIKGSLRNEKPRRRVYLLELFDGTEILHQAGRSTDDFRHHRLGSAWHILSSGRYSTWVALTRRRHHANDLPNPKRKMYNSAASNNCQTPIKSRERSRNTR